MNDNIALSGGEALSPITFIITLGGFIPYFYVILYYGCILFGLCMVAMAFWRQIDTAKGRGETTALQNVGYAFFGASLAIIGEIIGWLGKGIFGEYQDGSVLFYAAADDGGIARVAMAAFLYVLKFIGACMFIVGWRMLIRLTTGKHTQSDTGWGVFWHCFGGLCLIFIDITFGIISVLLGFNLSKFVNGL